MTKVTVLLSVLLSLLFIYNSLQAEDNFLQADFRHRPPEMIVEGKKMWGPLKDILEEAAKKIEYRIKWRIAPFARSLGDLKKGVSDILPRTVRTEEREVFVNYLGPIGYQQKDILFLVKKGKEDLINRYEDLKGLSIAVKRKTAYFKQKVMILWQKCFRRVGLIQWPFWIGYLLKRRWESIILRIILMRIIDIFKEMETTMVCLKRL